MTWSGSLTSRDAGRRRRLRYNSSSSNESRDTPSPKMGEERISPVQPDFNQSAPMLFRYTPPLQPTEQDGNSYAASRFNEPPAPELLPKPPARWTNTVSIRKPTSQPCSQLQMIFKVAAAQHA